MPAFAPFPLCGCNVFNLGIIQQSFWISDSATVQSYRSEGEGGVTDSSKNGFEPQHTLLRAERRKNGFACTLTQIDDDDGVAIVLFSKCILM